jgi:hypothetical protein
MKQIKISILRHLFLVTFSEMIITSKDELFRISDALFQEITYL